MLQKLEPFSLNAFESPSWPLTSSLLLISQDVDENKCLSPCDYHVCDAIVDFGFDIRYHSPSAWYRSSAKVLQVSITPLMHVGTVKFAENDGLTSEISIRPVFLDSVQSCLSQVSIVPVSLDWSINDNPNSFGEDNPKPFCKDNPKSFTIMTTDKKDHRHKAHKKPLFSLITIDTAASGHISTK